MASPLLDPLHGASRWLAVPVGAGPARVSRAEQLAARVRLVLETRPGDLPWSPEFGCAIDEYLGKPMTAQQLSALGSTVRNALQRWIPGAGLTRCQVRLLTDLGAGPGEANRAVPIAERALVPFSLRATLELDLELQTPEGPLSLQAILPP